jgi:hypothetical protein
MTVSLSHQIQEVERELHLRRGVYPRMVSSGKMRESVADFHMERLEAVLRTLNWLADNEEKIKAALGSEAHLAKN